MDFYPNICLRKAKAPGRPGRRKGIKLRFQNRRQEDIKAPKIPKMRILIACDKFKGSLSAKEACEALREGLGAADASIEVGVCPVADGGEGFAEAMVMARGGKWHSCESLDALGRPIEVRYGMVSNERGEDEAVMEMAEASGLHRIPIESRDVLRSSSLGTGAMIRNAVEQGVHRIFLGIGGSATNDGGMGVLAGLGVKFRDEQGGELEPVPTSLASLVEVDAGGMIELPPIEVACDVENPLLGPKGATMVYGPQKGAGKEARHILEDGLTRLVEVTGHGVLAETPGAGAAGGLGFGLLGFAGARLRHGFEMVAEALNLSDLVAACDIVITGEGSLDEQTFQGKAPVGVARIAREHGKKVIAVGGRVDPTCSEQGMFDRVLTLESFEVGEEQSMARAEELLQALGPELREVLVELRKS